MKCDHIPKNILHGIVLRYVMDGILIWCLSKLLSSILSQFVAITQAVISYCQFSSYYYPQGDQAP